jgi:hypothetical protein
MIVAEKVVTMIQRGDANTRWRDFADVIAITDRHPMKESELREAMNVVSSYRGATLETLIPALDGMPTVAQAKWTLWRSHQEHKVSNSTTRRRNDYFVPPQKAVNEE